MEGEFSHFKWYSSEENPEYESSFVFAGVLSIESENGHGKREKEKGVWEIRDTGKEYHVYLYLCALEKWEASKV